MTSGPDAGGIHIAPALGELSAVKAHYRLHWLELVRGYFLEVLQGIAFLLLALMAWSLVPFAPENRDISGSGLLWSSRDLFDPIWLCLSGRNGKAPECLM